MGRILEIGADISLLAAASAVGREEFSGPLGALFDYHDGSDRFGAATWELAEGELARLCLNLACARAGISHRALDLLFAGDLQNQCVATSGGLASFGVPYMGLYGACSTFAEGLIAAALSLAAAPALRLAAVVATSHNCAAERQFRLPIEYGGQRTPTAQWTATAGGAVILHRADARGEDAGGAEGAPAKGAQDAARLRAPHGAKGRKKAPRAAVTAVMPGRMVDAGIRDAANMGAAMAPAAADSILSYFAESGEDPCDYDAIVTGDLGREGSAILGDILAARRFSLHGRHRDCGAMLYDPVRQDVHAGGSGCGCIASVAAAYFLPRLARGEDRRILLLATGALMSPASLEQGGSIIGIAPLVRLEYREE